MYYRSLINKFVYLKVNSVILYGKGFVQIKLVPDDDGMIRSSTNIS